MKAMMQMSTLLITLVTMFVVVALLSTFTGEIVVNQYPTANVTNFSTLSKMGEMSNMTNQAYNTTSGATESVWGAAYYTIRGGWDTIKIMFESLNIFKSFSSDLAQITRPFGIPDVFYAFITILLTFVLIFAALQFMGKVNL